MACLLPLVLSATTGCETTANVPEPARERQREPAGRTAPRSGAPQSVLGTDLFVFAAAVSHALNDRDISPPPNNTYSHETAYSRRNAVAPYVRLEPTDRYSALFCTDCSGWVSFALATVSPLHHAVLQHERSRPEYNRNYESGFQLRESERTWARAFVLTNFFRSQHDGRHGFQTLVSHERLRPGDLMAYSLGRYTAPHNASLPRPPDTGHTFIIAGHAEPVDPSTVDYHANGTLAVEAAYVLAVPVIDASSIPHFDLDVRKNARGRFSLPTRLPPVRVRAGGIGLGTVWFALDHRDRIIQQRLGPKGTFRHCKVGAVRLNDAIVLDHRTVDSRGELVVHVFHNVTTAYDGASYGERPIDVLGYGGLRLAGGRLVLNGDNSFAGGVTVEDGWLIVRSDTGLGSGDLVVQAGHVRLERPALNDGASLRLAPDLADGSIHLDFQGEDTAWNLEIDGNVHGCGTWGSAQSGALFRDARFSGPGRLSLVGQHPSYCAGARRAAARASMAAPR